MSYQVIIPCAGTGSRLGSYTNLLNKALVSINNQPIISKIISQFPTDCQFIIPVGYRGKDLEEYLKIAHKDLDILIKYIDPYEGKDSGLGLTLLNVFDLIQDKFIFTSCDTLVKEKIPEPSNNWIGYSHVNDASSYRTVEIESNMATKLYEKKASKNLNAYIGLAGFSNHEEFKQIANENLDMFKQIGESFPLSKKIREFKAVPFTWYDTGNVAGLHKARETFSDNKNKKNILEKENEKIWFVEDKVIKFSTNTDFISNRVKRAKNLKQFVPNVTKNNEHMYSYSYIDSSIVSDSINVEVLDKLMVELNEFWKLKKLNDSDTDKFEVVCHDFYFDKTFDRINSFFIKYPFYDKPLIVNGIPIDKPLDILNKVDWANLAKGTPSSFHGDLHFENILYDGHQFKFLDWRDSFGGLIEYGDIYYDFAKLLHGILISHEIVLNGGYKIEESENKINIDIHMSDSYSELIPFLSKWFKDNKYDILKINTLTALIFLNIAPLHHDPYSRFLYFYGILNLQNIIEGKDIGWLS